MSHCDQFCQAFHDTVVNKYCIFYDIRKPFYDIKKPFEIHRESNTLKAVYPNGAQYLRAFRKGPN